MMGDGREYLTTEQATAMLDDGEMIHVFSNPVGGVMIGADWKRSDVLALFARAKPELAGEMATGAGHGIAVLDGDRRLFVATKRVG